MARLAFLDDCPKAAGAQGCGNDFQLCRRIFRIRGRPHRSAVAAAEKLAVADMRSIREALRDLRRPPETVGNLSTAKRIVFVHNTHWGSIPGGLHQKLPDGWAITTDRRWRNRAEALVFHIPTLLWLPRRTKPEQRWVAWSAESAENYPQLSDPAYMNRFDMTMTCRMDSDIPISYLFENNTGVPLNEFLAPLPPKRQDRLAAVFISSRFNRSGRLSYLKELMQHMDVHSYGSVLNNRTIPGADRGAASKMALLSGYRFNLAFENSVCVDYVTEKLYDPLRSGCVPVYLGAPNVARFTPGEHCYIDVRDYASPRHLAECLCHLAADDEAYAAYFAWKAQPLRPEFLRVAEACGEPLGVRLCKRLQCS